MAVEPPDAAVTADDGDEDEEEEASGPVISIDLSATYASSPGYGFLVNLPRLSPISLATPTSRSLTLDVPLKIEFNDRFSVHAAVIGSSQKLGSWPWSQFQIEAWRLGFSADIFQQRPQGAMPTVTLTGSVSQPFERAVTFFKTTTWSVGLDLERTFGAEETFALVAGASHAIVRVDFAPAAIRPTSIFYVGAWRRFEDWKLWAQAGVQHFDGARLASLVEVRPVTTPFVRLGLEQLDDDDNRLFAIGAAVGWSPKLAVLLQLNVPIYLAGR